MTPLLTVDEMKASAQGVGLYQLVKDGQFGDQSAALAAKIAAASGWITDTICRQHLVAEQRTEYDRDINHVTSSLMLVPNAYHVPLTLDSLEVGAHGINLIDIDITTSWVENGMFALPWHEIGWNPPGRGVAKFTYTAGFPNTTLASAVTAAATSVTVVDPTGITVGDVLTIPDGENTEQVAVTAVAGPVLTTSALSASHDAGVAIHEMPANVKEAAALATKAWIQGKTSGAYQMAQVSPSQPAANANPMQSNDLARAAEMLSDYVLP